MGNATAGQGQVVSCLPGRPWQSQVPLARGGGRRVARQDQCREKHLLSGGVRGRVARSSTSAVFIEDSCLFERIRRRRKRASLHGGLSGSQQLLPGLPLGTGAPALDQAASRELEPGQGSQDLNRPQPELSVCLLKGCIYMEELEEQRSCICCFSPQMATMAKAGPGRTQETKGLSHFPRPLGDMALK